MKITTTATGPVPKDAPGVRADSPAAQAYGSAAVASSAKVAVSDTGRRLASMQDGSNDIDVERVAAIVAQIAAGKPIYDTSKIADSLLASARELL